MNRATDDALSRPAGRCRPAVRGFRASYSRSTSRLNAIAADRAVAMQSRIPEPVLHPPSPAVGAPGRQRRAQERERQGEERVVKLHQIEIFASDGQAHARWINPVRKSIQLSTVDKLLGLRSLRPGCRGRWLPIRPRTAPSPVPGNGR